MILLALDPGLDLTGWAAFRVPRIPPVQPNQFRGALLGSGAFGSGPGAELPERLLQLHRGLAEVIAAHQPDLVVVEIPRIAGSYARTRAAAKTADGPMLGDLATMHRATGALLLAARLLGVEADTRRASAMKKPLKSAWVVNIWPELGNRKSNADQRDAIHLGATALGDYARAARRSA